MDSKQIYISSEALPQWFQSIVEASGRVVAPSPVKKGIDFIQVSSFHQVQMAYTQSVQSPKSVVFPKVEPILTYVAEGNDIVIENVDERNDPSTVLWAVHPCDIRSFKELEAVFMGERIDARFAARYSKLTVVGLACIAPDENCFCTSVGLSSTDADGCDIMLFPLKKGGFKVDVLSDKGEALIALDDSLFSKYIDDELVELPHVPILFNVDEVSENLKSGFEHPYWDKSALRCSGCGTCAFVCPTCTCFDMQDEKRGKKGYRLRCWDSCATGLFTLHTSGHNPRESQGHRWRQRLMHKFSYIPQSRQTTGCVGCGRCSRACPADMNMPEHLNVVASWNQNS